MRASSQISLSRFSADCVERVWVWYTQASESPLSGTPVAAAPVFYGDGVRGGAAKRSTARPVGEWPDRDAGIARGFIWAVA